ncbi:hypothetical protein H6G97_44465 [Nostoc flagelliforme FACHB-838]|uniref:LemA family protein n=1 Tax=Nostoc flagelliforme FACHB-838 TaxID=2692904 RepID=A0ABR8E3A9_9NOSO|nr:hypothetical protein [Nostoc flagelliforme]MBD2536005.1 hypothetical protein [Nostoc flagelliforme FACHB-838]
MGLLIFSVALVAIVALIIINAYNDLVKYRNLVANTFNFTVAELLPEATPEMRNAPRVSF